MPTRERLALAASLLLALSLGLPGCAGRGAPATPEAATPDTDKTAAWVGRTEPEIVAVYGEPSRRLATSGGAIVYYRSLDVDADPDEPPSGRTEEIGLGYDAKFWLDGKGEIYRVWMSSVALAEFYRPPR